ncbi:MAG TPA: MnhB domain-containing protein [Candidatus Baltobacteraceae bacterium]|nr:MnhB domain-containing protein [Candidatus Baltobacteraceae bacterium]
MSVRVRTWVYVLSAIIAFGTFMAAVGGLPPFGSFSGPYTDMLLQIATLERSVDNIPTAVNFDYRGFDTLGEEFIFFTSVVGVLFLFSSVKGAAEAHPEPMESELHRGQTGAIRWFPIGLTAFIAALGMDLGAHGQLTPGGGFQGGAIFGGGMACIYLALGLQTFVKTAHKETFDMLEALGAFSFAALGVAGLFIAGAFLKNIMPLGQTGATVSGGTIYFLSCAVFVEIACGFTILMLAFLKQTRHAEEDEG